MRTSPRAFDLIRAACLPALLLPLCACRQEMYDQPHYEPMEASSFFGDGLSARPMPVGTVVHGDPRTDTHFYEGKVDGKEAETFPIAIDRALLDRGQERFNIYCSPCHGRLGDGKGMIVDRGFSPPPSYHIDRLRNAPVGHFFNVITHGHGAMYSYAARVAPRDRWAIIAYVRALQLSQHASRADLPAEELRRLEGVAR